VYVVLVWEGKKGLPHATASSVTENIEQRSSLQPLPYRLLLENKGKRPGEFQPLAPRRVHFGLCFDIICLFS